jgi:hypothetical protein
MALNCKADLRDNSNWSKECGTCNKCSPVSALQYPFERDLENSKMLIEEIKEFIHNTTGLFCRETEELKKPDLIVEDANDKLIARVESKFLEGKAFMKVDKMLEDSLKPKETLVVDEPKLLSYFSCKEDDSKRLEHSIPIFVVWKFDRPCYDVGGICVYQEIDILRVIYSDKGARRKFRRKTASSDYVSGERMGIIDKYHFSISECKPIESLPEDLLNAAR